MKALRLLLASSLLAGATALHASVTINLFGGQLSDSSGTAMFDGGLVLLVASTTDSIFTAPSTTSSLTAGSFLSGDDVILSAFAINSNNTGFAGGFGYDSTLNYSGNINSGDLLQLYWFPTLTLSSTSISEGISYGVYRTDSIASGSNISWALPSDGQNVTLQFLTNSSGSGNIADSFGYANLTTVPEPATTVALLGAVAGLFVIHRRRQRKSADSPALTQ